MQDKTPRKTSARKVIIMGVLAAAAAFLIGNLLKYYGVI